MISEVINSIIEAETEAAKIEQLAKQSKKDIIAKAEISADELRKTTIDNVAKEIQEATILANEKIKKQHEEIIGKANKKALNMRADCLSASSECEDYIMREIVKKYDC